VPEPGTVVLVDNLVAGPSGAGPEHQLAFVYWHAGLERWARFTALTPAGAPTLGFHAHADPCSGPAAPGPGAAIGADTSESSSHSSDDEEGGRAPRLVTQEHIEAVSAGLASLEAQLDPTAPPRCGVPLEWGTATAVLGLVDPNPGGLRPWAADRSAVPLIDLTAPRARDVWVRPAGALCVPAGPYGRMVGGTPLPLIATLITNLLGLGLPEREIPTPDASRSTFAPAGGAPPVPGRSADVLDDDEAFGPSGSAGGPGPWRRHRRRRRVRSPLPGPGLPAWGSAD